MGWPVCASRASACAVGNINGADGEVSLRRDGDDLVDGRANDLLQAGVGIDLRQFLRIRRPAQRDIELGLLEHLGKHQLVGA